MHVTWVCMTCQSKIGMHCFQFDRQGAKLGEKSFVFNTFNCQILSILLMHCCSPIKPQGPTDMGLRWPMLIQILRSKKIPISNIWTDILYIIF